MAALFCEGHSKLQLVPSLFCRCIVRCTIQPTAFCSPLFLICSLRDHLAAKCGGAAAPAFQAVQRAFVESLAAYSLVCYLLQIKDRCAGTVDCAACGLLVFVESLAAYSLVCYLLQIKDRCAAGVALAVDAGSTAALWMLSCGGCVCQSALQCPGLLGADNIAAIECFALPH